MTVLQEGEVVAVLRECRACGEWKPLEHFLLCQGRLGKVVADVKVCAKCRRQPWEEVSVLNLAMKRHA